MDLRIEAFFLSEIFKIFSLMKFSSNASVTFSLIPNSAVSFSKIGIATLLMCDGIEEPEKEYGPQPMEGSDIVNITAIRLLNFIIFYLPVKSSFAYPKSFGALPPIAVILLKS